MIFGDDLARWHLVPSQASKARYFGISLGKAGVGFRRGNARGSVLLATARPPIVITTLLRGKPSTPQQDARGLAKEDKTL